MSGKLLGMLECPRALQMCFLVDELYGESRLLGTGMSCTVDNVWLTCYSSLMNLQYDKLVCMRQTFLYPTTM